MVNTLSGISEFDMLPTGPPITLPLAIINDIEYTSFVVVFLSFIFSGRGR